MKNKILSFFIFATVAAAGILSFGGTTITPVNVGTTANDGTGDPLRGAFVKLNNNESALLAGKLETTNGLSTNLMSLNGTNINGVMDGTNVIKGFVSHQATETNAAGAPLAFAPVSSVIGNFAALNNSGLLSDSGYSWSFLTNFLNLNNTVLITNNSTAATIQAQLNNDTNGFPVYFAQGDYNLSAALVITNPMYIYGNLATLHWTNATAILLTGPMFDTTTNYGKMIIIDGLRMDLGVPEQYNTASYYANNLIANGFYGNTFWSNRMAIRVEASGGAIIKDCRIWGCSGTAILLNNLGDNGGSIFRPRPIVINNWLATNFVGVMLPGSSFEVPGYNNSPSGAWADFEPDYTLVIANHIDTCQVGIAANCPNETIENNICPDNYIGIMQSALGGGCMVVGNNLNHCTIGDMYVGGGGWVNFYHNEIVASTMSFVGVNATNLDMEYNTIGQGLIYVTNTPGGLSSGWVAHNRCFQGSTWASNIGFITNTMMQFGNFDQAGQLSDGSNESALEKSNSLPTMTFIGAPQGSIYCPTNVAPHSVIDNFSYSGANVVNTYGMNVRFHVGANFTGAWPSGGGLAGTAQEVLHITNKGTACPLVTVGWIQEGVGTNQLSEEITVDLGTNDGFSMAPITQNTGSSISFPANAWIEAMP